MDTETKDQAQETRPPRRRLSWEKRISLLVLGLILAYGIKLLVQEWLFLGPMPESRYPQLGGDFRLLSARGPVALHDFQGKVVVLYFGYTHCPDICPTTLASLAAALRILTEMGELDHVQGLFVTLDPERDGVEEVTNFSAYFHPKIMGLSADAPEISAVARLFLVGHQQEAADAGADYAISHTGYLYIIRPDGSVGELLSHTSAPRTIVEAIDRWLPWARRS